MKTSLRAFIILKGKSIAHNVINSDCAIFAHLTLNMVVNTVELSRSLHIPSVSKFPHQSKGETNLQ